MATGMTFQEACCEKPGNSPDDFEQAWFWRCIPPQSLLVVRLRWHIHPACFESDFDLIRTRSDCTSLTEVCEEIANYRSISPNCGLPNKTFERARLSAQLLVNFARTFSVPQLDPSLFKPCPARSRFVRCQGRTQRTVTVPGVTKICPDPKKLVMEDCIKPVQD